MRAFICDIVLTQRPVIQSFIALVLTVQYLSAAVTRSPSLDGGLTCSGRPCLHAVTSTSSTVVNGKRRVSAAELTDLQNALDSPQLCYGDRITIEADTEFATTGSSRFTTPGALVCGTGSVTLSTSEFAKLPPAGTRVTPNDIPLMPRLTNLSSQMIFTTTQSATPTRDWVIEGIQFVGDTGTTFWGDVGRDSVNIGIFGETDPARTPIRVYLKHVLVTAQPLVSWKGGIRLAGRDVGVEDSSVYWLSSNSTFQDSNCISFNHSTGPFYIRNSFLDCAGEAFMTYGTAPSILGATFEDRIVNGVVIEKNSVYKYVEFHRGSPWADGEPYFKGRVLKLADGRSFQAQQTGVMCVGGQPITWNSSAAGVTTTDTCAPAGTWVYTGVNMYRAHKNGGEFKGGLNARVELNLFENSWTDYQAGACLSMKPESNSSDRSAFENFLRNVVVRGNQMKNCGFAILVQTTADYWGGDASNIKVTENLFVDPARYDGSSGPFSTMLFNFSFTDDFEFSKNTVDWRFMGGLNKFIQFGYSHLQVPGANVNATTDVISVTNTGTGKHLLSGEAVTVFEETAGVPAPLVSGATYYALNVSPGTPAATAGFTFQLAAGPPPDATPIDLQAFASAFRITPSAFYRSNSLKFNDNIIWNRGTNSIFYDLATANRTGNTALTNGNFTAFQMTGNNLTTHSAFNSTVNTTTYPAGNFATPYASAGFTRWTDTQYEGPNANDYRLLSTSPMLHTASHGGATGANLDNVTIINDIAVTPLDTKVLVQYTLTSAIADTPCVIQFSPNADYTSPVADINPLTYLRPASDMHSSSIRGSRDRMILIGSRAALTPGTTYYYQLECAGDIDRGSVTTLASLATTGPVYTQTTTRPAVDTIQLVYGTAYDRSTGTISGGATVTQACAANAVCSASATVADGFWYKQTIEKTGGAAGAVVLAHPVVIQAVR